MKNANLNLTRIVLVKMVLNTLLVSKMKWKSFQDENAFKNESTCKNFHEKK